MLKARTTEDKEGSAAPMGFADQRFNVNLSILFTELPLLERPAAAAAAGFTAVELWWPWVDSPVPERSGLACAGASSRSNGSVVNSTLSRTRST